MPVMTGTLMTWKFRCRDVTNRVSGGTVCGAPALLSRSYETRCHDPAQHIQKEDHEDPQTHDSDLSSSRSSPAAAFPAAPLRHTSPRVRTVFPPPIGNLPDYVGVASVQRRCSSNPPINSYTYLPLWRSAAGKRVCQGFLLDRAADS
jgi:hypothetical protein